MARNKSTVRTAGSIPKVATNNGHHDGPKPPDGSFDRGAFHRISACAQLADVVHLDYDRPQNKFVEASAEVRKSSGGTDRSPFLAALVAHPAVQLATVRHWHQEERKRIVEAKASGLLNTA